MNKMLRKLIAPVLGLTIIMATSASAITIGFSQIGQESDWRTANTDSVCNAIEAHEGWELVYSDGQQKQENQIQALNNFITQGVDYILFTGVVTSGWDEILSEVNENEIPLILLDRIPDCADKIDYVAAFGGDFPLEGRRQVQWAGEYLKSLGRDSETVNVAIMEGTTGAAAPRKKPVIAERIGGIRKVDSLRDARERPQQEDQRKQEALRRCLVFLYAIIELSEHFHTFPHLSARARSVRPVPGRPYRISRSSAVCAR